MGLHLHFHTPQRGCSLPARLGIGDQRISHHAAVQCLLRKQPLLERGRRTVLWNPHDIGALRLLDVGEETAIGITAISHVTSASFQMAAQHVVLALRAGVACPRAIDAMRTKRLQIELGVQPPAVNRLAIASGVVATLHAAGRFDQAAKTPQHRPVHQRDGMAKIGKTWIALRRQLSRQLLDQRFKPLRFKNTYRFGKAAQRKTLDPKRPGHLRQRRGFLQIPHRLDQRIPGIKEHELAVIIEVQFPIARPIAPAAHLVKPGQQVKNPLQMLQAEDVLFLNASLHAPQDATDFSKAQSQYLALARTLCRTALTFCNTKEAQAYRLSDLGLQERCASISDRIPRVYPTHSATPVIGSLTGFSYSKLTVYW